MRIPHASALLLSVALGTVHVGALAQADPALFLQRHPPPVIIDEVRGALGAWRDVVRGLNLGAAELDVLEDAIAV